jgi:hypothetical protein
MVRRVEGRADRPTKAGARAPDRLKGTSMTKATAFCVELERVDMIASLIAATNATTTQEKGRPATPNELAVAIEIELSKPESSRWLRGRIVDALKTTGWGPDTRRQNLASILRTVAHEGMLVGTADEAFERLADAVLTELRVPSIAMVDAGQQAIVDGKTNFMAVWMKALERA